VDDDAKRFISSAKLDADFDVNNFTLYKSVLTASGPVYEQLAVYPSQPLSHNSGQGTS
jgi:2'-5' RNA ligase